MRTKFNLKPNKYEKEIPRQSANVILTVFLLYLSFFSRAQKSVLFDIGVTYFTNEIVTPCNCLNDFAAVTFNSRIIMLASPNSSVSLEIPLSLRSRIRDDIMTRFGLHVPVAITYNYGAGASGNPSQKKIGFLVGAGWGYYYQKATSKAGESPPFNSSVSISGPQGLLGIRLPMRRIELFKIKNRPVHPSLTIKFIDLVDLRSSHRNIGGLSLLMGMSF